MKILWLSDMDLKGSGYLNISTPLCNGLVDAGHEVRVLGLGYEREEHFNKFSLIKCTNFNEMFAMVENLKNMDRFDVFVVALDIPLQIEIMNNLHQRDFKYVGIMPVESDPLIMDWAMTLMAMDKTFIISQFGTDEAIKAGVEAGHLQVGIDTKSWRSPTTDERKRIRQSMFGVDDDGFLVLTVADNQERKNLSKAMKMFAEFSKDKPNSKYVLVTRERAKVGWKLRTLANDLGFGDRFMLFERGIPFKELWSIYAACDCFLLTSKAEGLGMPILEAMSVGMPVIATNCTALKELLADNRGLLIEVMEECTYTDPFGNGNRYVVDVNHGAELLDSVYKWRNDTGFAFIGTSRDHSRKYVEARTWDIPIQQVNRALEELNDAK